MMGFERECNISKWTIAYDKNDIEKTILSKKKIDAVCEYEQGDWIHRPDGDIVCDAETFYRDGLFYTSRDEARAKLPKFREVLKLYGITSVPVLVKVSGRSVLSVEEKR